MVIGHGPALSGNPGFWLADNDNTGFWLADNDNTDLWLVLSAGVPGHAGHPRLEEAE